MPFGPVTQGESKCEFCITDNATRWVNVNVLDSTWAGGGYCHVYVYCDKCYAIAEPFILKSYTESEALQRKNKCVML